MIEGARAGVDVGEGLQWWGLFRPGLSKVCVAVELFGAAENWWGQPMTRTRVVSRIFHLEVYRRLTGGSIVGTQKRRLLMNPEIDSSHTAR
jgi:hypothetical protein